MIYEETPLEWAEQVSIEGERAVRATGAAFDYEVKQRGMRVYLRILVQKTGAVRHESMPYKKVAAACAYAAGFEKAVRLFKKGAV